MKQALGKGLSQLIAEQSESPLSEVAIDAIVPNPRQPRTRFVEDSLHELAASIRQVGVLQPLVVRPVGEGKYELIAGERRLRASQIAGLARVPVVIRSASHQQSLEIALIENVQREDIGPIEAAKAYRRLMDEFELTQEQVATKVGKSRPSIANTVRLLALPSRAIEGLEAGEVTEGQVRPLLGVPDPVSQLALYDVVIQKGLSAREVERLVAPKAKQARRAKTVIDATDPNWRALRDALSEKLGAPVRLTGSEKGGAITIPFVDEADLMRIADGLGIEL